MKLLKLDIVDTLSNNSSVESLIVNFVTKVESTPVVPSHTTKSISFNNR